MSRRRRFGCNKKVMESDEYINPNIRPYFQQFIDNCENNGYSFKQAITF